MRLRNEQGKFIKKELENTQNPGYFVIQIPQFSSIIFYLIIILVLLPWILIIFKAELPSKIISWSNNLLFEQTTPLSSTNNGSKDSQGGYWTSK